jgi:hypothetical protein
LQRPDGPNLLGGSQVLVDGGRIVFSRNGPDSALLRDLWCLLPTSTRSELWPANFAFGNALQFHVLAVPDAEGEEYEHYHTEERAGDYPEGRYELALQTAAESGDQRELDKLFARRSQAETLKLAVYLLIAAVIVLLVAGLVNPPQPPRAADAKPPVPKEVAPLATLDLPPSDQYSPLEPAERIVLRWRLRELSRQAGATWPRDAILRQIGFGFAGGSQAAPLAASIVWAENWGTSFSEPEDLLDVLDQRLGTPDAGREPGPLKNHGPLERRLRVLLWKHGVASYNDERLNPFELLERIEPLIPRR